LLCFPKDWDLSWNTDNPVFTPCFEHTVLAFLAPAFLWVFAPLDLYFSRVSVYSTEIPWSALNIGKLFLNGFLSTIETGFQVMYFFTEVAYPVDLWGPVVRSLTFSLYMGLLLYSKKRGICSSGVQFLFWLILTLTQGIRFRTVISGLDRLESHPLVYVAEVVYFPLVVGQFILHCWADIPPIHQNELNSKTKKKITLEASASFLSKLVFEWVTPLAWVGFRKPLEYSDLWHLNWSETSQHNVPLFDQNWPKDLNRGLTSTSTTTEQKKSSEDTKEAGVLIALSKTFGWTYLVALLIRTVTNLLLFVSPQILNILIDFVSSSNEPTWKGILYATIMFLSAFIGTIFAAYALHMFYLTGLHAKSALVSAVYRKALLLSNSAKRAESMGEIVNHMAVDVNYIAEFSQYAYNLWGAPVIIAMAFYFLWGILGPSSLAGFVVILILLPLNLYIASKAQSFQKQQMRWKDKRTKLMNEILSGIKVLKLYAWEPSFENQVLKIRNEELRVLRTIAYLNSISDFIWTCSPFLVAICTFGTYVLIDKDRVLDAQTAFVSLSLFNLMSQPLTFFPFLISSFIQASVGVKRLSKYLNADELDLDTVSHSQTEANPIVIQDGCFSWDKDSETDTLKDINLQVKEGQLVAILGAVGAGKSSLLSSLLNELIKTCGYANIKGNIAYVAQQAWIQNGSVKDNILFGKPYDSQKYNKILEACALLPDLEMLVAGDKTEIGEKGINLSGGQRQRLSLARAVYSNADVFLLDDPLSAVDAHVGKHIFEKVLGPKGILRRKTRLLVTHGIGYLPSMDNIIVMMDGRISEEGTYQELLDRKGAFSEFLKQHSSSSSSSSSIENEVKSIPKTLKGSGSTSEMEYLSTEETLRRRKYSKASMCSSIAVSEAEKDHLIEIEKAETKSVKASVYLDYFQAAGWTIACATLALHFTFQVFSVGANLWLSEWTSVPLENSIGNETSPAPAPDQTFYLTIYGCLGVCQGVAILFASLVMAIGTVRSSNVIHFRTLHRIMRAPLSFFDVTPLGRIVNRFSRDVDSMDNILPLSLRYVLSGSFSVLATLVVISISTPIFIALVPPVGLLYFFVQKFYIATSRQLKRLESVTRSPIYSHFGETLSGATTIRAFRQQERFVMEMEEKVDHNMRSYHCSVSSNRWLQVRLETIGNSVVFFAALFAVLGRETLSPGLVGLSVSYALQITMALIMLVRITSDMETNIVAVERLKEYSDVVQEAAWETNDPFRKPVKEWPQAGKIVFDSYQTKYRPGLDLVLRNVSCTINPGEKIGIVGRTGAGKSSMTLAVFRIGLPGGLDYEVAEGGENLSVGQRSLVCLARALLRRTKILVLDEATASVDLDTDELIQKTIRKEFKDATVITIAHRLNTILDSDRVIVMDNGEIREFDSPQNLLGDENSIFCQMTKESGTMGSGFRTRASQILHLHFELIAKLDWDLTWNTNNPFFTSCFEHTVLALLAPAFLWAFAPLDLYFSRVSVFSTEIPWSALNIGKLFLNGCLSTIETGFQVMYFFSEVAYPVDLWGPVVLSLTYSLYMGLLLYSKKRGICSSGVQFLFWLILTLTQAIRFRTVISGLDRLETHPLVCVAEVVYFPLVVGQFILHCWADIPQIHQNELNSKMKKKITSEASASFLSKLFFEWFTPLAWTGFRKPLEYSDLWHLNWSETSQHNVPLFDENWPKDLNRGLTPISPTKEQRNSLEDKKEAGVLLALSKTFGWTYLIAFLICTVTNLLLFVSPQILNILIDFVSSSTEPTWKGILYATIMFLSGFIGTIITGYALHMFKLIGLHAKSALVSAVYRKALLLSNSAKRAESMGEIVNHMAVDVNYISEFTQYAYNLWCAPAIIAMAFYFLWGILGPSSSAGFVVILVLLPLNLYVASKAKSFQKQQMRWKDKRTKLMNEILSGIKVLKLNAWEPSFENQVLKIRNEELRVLRRIAYLNSISDFIWTCAPFLVAISTFGTYVLIDKDRVLDAQTAFVSLSLFNLISQPLTYLPFLISSFIQASVGVKRLSKYLNADELDLDTVSHSQTETNPIVIKDGCFSWDKESENGTLEDINLQVKEGQLVAILGEVGAGKSSLLSSLLNELIKTRGYVNIKGNIAYVAQQAWIQNGSVRDNILFGKPYDSHKYNKILEACALLPDLEILVAGDKTEIGEKGINLSGGQRQRLALARAVYSNADVFLLDDPLSAVDAHVGKHIFEKVLGPKGLLRKKTRLLVTHGIVYLPFMDNIIVMSDGQITEEGTYQQLLNRKGAFADFLKQHSSSSSSSSPSLETEVKTVPTSGDTSEIESSTSGGSNTRRKHRKASIASSFTTSTIEKDRLIEIEKAETKNVKASVYLNYFQAAGWTIACATLALHFTFQVFSVGANLWLSEWTSVPLENAKGNETSHDQTFYLTIYGCLGVCQGVAILFASLVMAIGTVRSSNVIHFRTLHRIMRAPLSFFDVTPLGRIVNRFAKDCSPMSLRYVLSGTFSVLATLVVISISTPIFIALVPPVGLLYFFVQKFYIATSRQLKRLESVTRSPIYSQFSETISGATTIRAFRQQERFVKEMEQKVDHNMRSYYCSVSSNRWMQIRLETLGHGVVFFAALFAVLGRETLSPGLVGLSVSYALQITAALMVLVRMFCDMETNIVAVERLKEYNNVVQEAAWETKEQLRKPEKEWPQGGQIVFDSYHTKYRPGLDLVLRNVSCTINPGEKIGIVGRTGAGKSSLSLAIFRIGLPGGLDYEVAEGGENLSVGQKSLVCLARALLRRTKILVLDEATASVDLDTDELIQKTIRKEFKDATVINIAHRLNTILDSDRVIVMDNGEIREFDSPQNLLGDDNSIFSQLAKESGAGSSQID
ncbi:Multidrug resistance-associated protein 1, partial [Orchesella cincta]